MESGNSLNFQLSFFQNEKKFNKKNTYSSQIESFQKLQDILELNNIGLKSVDMSEEKAVISVRQNSYSNQYAANQAVLLNSLELQDLSEQEVIEIRQFIHGMEVMHVSYKKDNLGNIRNEKYTNHENVERRYTVEDSYPYLYSNFSPRINTIIASREGFLYQGLMLEHDFEMVIDESLIFKSNLKYSISDNYDGLYIPPPTTYPNQVRSDVKDYLRNYDRGIVVGRAEINYFKGYGKQHFLRLSGGLFEDMFGGLGLDYVYHPEGSLIALGFESYFVKKRDYNLRFGFKKYQNYLSRVSARLQEPKTNVYFDVSYGEYLAGDVGATVTLTKRFDNGIKMSAFFSKTNVSFSDYGEGSFDKGIRIIFPFPNLFSKNKRLSKWEWHPLTKDPAALLNKSNDLFDEIERYRIY